MYLANPRKRRKVRRSSRRMSNTQARRRRSVQSRKRRSVARRSTTRRRRRTAVATRAPRRLRRHALYATNPARRKSRRSGTRRRSSGSRGGLFGGLVSKSDLMVAAGAVGGGIVSSQIISRFGSILPGMTNPWVAMIYRAGLPIAGAYVVKKYSPDLAKGMVIGGVVTALNDVLSMVLTPANPAAVGAYLGAYPGGRAGTGAWTAINQFSGPADAGSPGLGGADLYVSKGAFATDAWAM